jgi:hypothetical protein
MKKKIISLVILSFLLTSVAVYAFPNSYTLWTAGTGTSELSFEQAHSSPRSVKMATIDMMDRGRIIFEDGISTLIDIDELSYWTYTVQAGTFDQLTAWMGIYLHEEPGKTLDDWYNDYPSKTYYIQAEPVYTTGNPTLSTWEKQDAYDATYPLRWVGIESPDYPYEAPPLEDYIDGDAVSYTTPYHGVQSFASREYGSLYVCAIIINMGYGGPWANTLAYVDDVTIGDYYEGFDTEFVQIDIKPETYPNSINLDSKGRVPVAVLTTDDFDATTVDPVTVEFADTMPLRWTVKDVDSDGDLDLLFFFKTQELDLDSASTEATLTGKTFDLVNIVGTDTVNIVP